MDGLEDAGVGADRGAGQQAHGTCDARAFIREDVAEGIFGDHDIEETGFLNHAHSGIVNVHVVGGDVGVLGGNLLCDLAPETRGGEDVGLIHDGKVTAALAGITVGYMKDALDFGTAVEVGIVGFIIALFLGAEVHASGKFANADEIGSTDKVILEG